MLINCNDRPAVNPVEQTEHRFPLPFVCRSVVARRYARSIPRQGISCQGKRPAILPVVSCHERKLRNKRQARPILRPTFIPISQPIANTIAVNNRPGIPRRLILLSFLRLLVVNQSTLKYHFHVYVRATGYLLQ